MSLRVPHRPQRAFTLVEIIVALTIMLVLAAVIVPTVGNQLDMASAQSTANTILALQSSLSNPTPPTGQRVGFAEVMALGSGVDIYPSRLDHLTQLIVLADRRCSAAVYATSAANMVPYTNAWNTYGPFYANNIVRNTAVNSTTINGGLVTPVGTIRDTLVRTAANKVEIWLDSVTLDNAHNIEAILEPGTTAYDGVNGNVKYANVTVGTTTFFRLRFGFNAFAAGCP